VTVSEPETHTYKRVGDLAIELDVYREAASPERQLVVWIHGGALIDGDRSDVPAWLLDAAGESRFAVASVDYRLAPETKLPEIVGDVEDALAWLRRLPFARIAVVGESAGGYLSLVAGFRVRPPLAAVVSIYGYGDLIGPWYSEPSPHPGHHQVEPSEEEAYLQVAGPPVAQGRQREGDGWVFYQFCRQRGIWPREVSGWDPREESRRFRPFMPLENVTSDFPATLLIHGELDTDVPHEQSELMAAALGKQGVDHRLLSVAGAEHGLAGADRDVLDDAFRQAASFLRERLGP
jgi:acetyl esterase/lipase